VPPLESPRHSGGHARPVAVASPGARRGESHARGRRAHQGWADRGVPLEPGPPIGECGCRRLDPPSRRRHLPLGVAFEILEVLLLAVRV
jgi:hypothetical protein